MTFCFMAWESRTLLPVAKAWTGSGRRCPFRSASSLHGEAVAPGGGPELALGFGLSGLGCSRPNLYLLGL